ncbi:MAG: arsenosugar biosynthesis radical SAM protein ArsS [Thermodesulfovibrionales bacterium]
MRFSDHVREILGGPLTALSVSTLQVNLGYRCNMSCRHCHVEAGPHRSEAMSDETLAEVLKALAHSGATVLDITGGAPELHPRFPMLVEAARSSGTHVIVRSNLTVLVEERGEELLDLYRTTGVEIIASLPSTSREQVDRVRGKGAFDKSVNAVKRLNSMGYGHPGGGRLSFVFNPSGAFLPPLQETLEQEYRRELSALYGISFNNLYTFANMPIGRFRDFLLRSGNLVQYQKRLIDAFNPLALEGVMCRRLLSVGWDGRLHDCDFNQMADIPVTCRESGHIRDFDQELLSCREIAAAEHCYGCTAGQGST